MHSLIIAALATFALAIPTTLASRSACMCEEDAQNVANNFKNLIGAPFSRPLARSAMTKDFVDYSDSVIELINAGCSTGPKTLTEPVFDSRSEFDQGQSSQAPIPFEILNLWNSCNSVTIRWRTSAPGTVVEPQQPVTGIIVLETEANSKAGAAQPWLINTVYSEFNSGAWLVDIGTFVPTCNATTA